MKIERMHINFFKQIFSWGHCLIVPNLDDNTHKYYTVIY